VQKHRNINPKEAEIQHERAIKKGWKLLMRKSDIRWRKGWRPERKTFPRNPKQIKQMNDLWNKNYPQYAT
jgi:hypothetical protein